MSEKVSGTRKPKGAARIEIEVWMLREGLDVKALAEQLGVTSVAIYRFLDGVMASRRIREHLVETGCPEGALDRLREKEAA